MKHVGENEADRFCFALTCDPRQGEGQWKWYKMVEVGAYKNGRFEKIWLSNLRETSNVKALATSDGSQQNKHNSLQMDKKKLCPLDISTKDGDKFG